MVFEMHFITTIEIIVNILEIVSYRYTVIMYSQNRYTCDPVHL